MRKRLYEIIEVSEDGDRLSLSYDVLMMCAIVISVIPLAFKTVHRFFIITDIITVTLFILDYLFRLATADLKLGQKGVLPFLRYPFTPFAVIDLLSILPALSILSSGFKLLRLFRIIRTFRVFRIFKAFRYSKSFSIIIKVMKNSKEALLAVFTLAAGYILVSALVIFNVEPDSFDTYFDAVYWATVSLSTVGYGDIYPVTTPGRIITMLSSVLGIAIVALPSGIITAGYMDAIRSDQKKG